MTSLLTQEDIAQLLENGTNAAGGADSDPYPVVRLFAPDGASIWLLSELNPDEPDLAYGLCDLGDGSPELGYVSLSELAARKGPLGLPPERDMLFRATMPLSAYARLAAAEGRIA